MRITTTDKLIDLLDAAINDREGLYDPDPPIDNPQRYKGSDATYKAPPQGAEVRPMEQTHFCYFGRGDDDTLRTLVYSIDATASLPSDATLTTLIAAARQGGITVAGGTLASKNPTMEWRKPGFVIFCVDLPGWRFLEKTNSQGQSECHAIYFAEMDGAQGKKWRNRSFYNARFLTVSVGAEAIKLVVVENHHLKATAGSARRARPKFDPSIDEYKYDIFLTMRIENSNPPAVLPMIIDPGGKNIGPP